MVKSAASPKKKSMFKEGEDEATVDTLLVLDVTVEVSESVNQPHTDIFKCQSRTAGTQHSIRLAAATRCSQQIYSLR